MPTAVKTIFLLLILLAWPLLSPATPESDQATFRQWIKQMKTVPRGPFRRIRWFCNDGEILPPEPYACVSHGGGIQHGQWSERTERLRAAGYRIANVLAEYARDDSAADVDRDLLREILLERFLVNRDNGWIFRRARFYRGAIQREDEARGESALVRRFATTLDATTRDYLLLWEATRLLPGRAGGDLLEKMRDLATRINEQDEAFATLRSKLHAAPVAGDAAAVRDHAASAGKAELQADYETLAQTIDALFDPGPLAGRLRKAARRVHVAGLRRALRDAAAARVRGESARARLADCGRLLLALHERLDAEPSAAVREALLRLGQAIEKDVFVSASELQSRLDAATRRERLGWLTDSARALAGVGLLTLREWRAVRQSLSRLEADSVPLARYRDELNYLGRAPRWASQLMQYQFGPAVEKFSAIEPLAAQFIPARLRGSPLAFYAAVLDSLQRDADTLAGGGSELFGEPVATGLRALNAGLARGRLLTPRPGQPMQADGIYLLPQTTAELTPVAGIITLDEGNTLSHVQLLAANLGIPNVVVSSDLLPRLRRHLGERVVLAVSPGGVVRIAADGPRWDAVFEQQGVPDSPLRPDRDKLDLSFRDFISLDRLRASDSGVIVGPKAANLGELKHFFPDAVADGVAIPFGRFRAFLERPLDAEGRTLLSWMQRWYRYLDSLPAEKRKAATEKFLHQIHDWIEHASPGEAFRAELADALERVFGDSEGVRLFVRSDTNVEDLPGFTGAGLNLTVPNVVGMDALIRAVMRVWASPFTARAFAWRQQRMADPIDVYPSVLLLETVTVEKSGVLLTFNTLDGSDDWFTVAVAHGIGGAVQGESAEELLVRRDGGELRLLNSAASPTMRVAGPDGGLVEVPAPPTDAVLTPEEIDTLRRLVDKVEKDLPQFDDKGRPTPADIEFGFRDGRLALFQIRPYLRSRQARRNRYLLSLDRKMAVNENITVEMNAVPESLQ